MSKTQLSDPCLDPPRSVPTYVVRAPPVRWLREETREAHAAIGDYPVLDVGCGAKPYELLFEPHASVRVTPASGTTACLELAAMHLDLGFRRVGLGFAVKPLVAAVNTVATAVDRRSSHLRELAPGRLFANVHVVAEVPR